LTKKAQIAPFRKADLNNLPLQEARQRFLAELAKHCQVLQTLFDAPLKMWDLLSGAAKDRCRFHGWTVIQFSPTYTELDQAITAGDDKLREEQQIHIEMIPLRESLAELAREFGLIHKGEPAPWAMDAAVETLHQAGRRPLEKRILQWYPAIEGMSEGYPALTEPGVWRHVNGEPEEELFTLKIEIGPKQPTETLKAFRKRFNKTCREEREQYIRELQKAEWITVQRLEHLAWIDRLAQWQARRSQSEIDPFIKSPDHRAALSRDIKRAGSYIGISPRKSKHDPLLGRSRL
jgi:hypothetical protein